MLPYKPMLAITAANSKDIDVTKSKDFVRNLRKKEVERKKELQKRQEKMHNGSVKTLKDIIRIREMESLEQEKKKKQDILAKLEQKRQERKVEVNKSQEHIEKYLGKWGKPKDRLHHRIQESYRSNERIVSSSHLKERMKISTQMKTFKPSSLEFKDALTSVS